MKEDKKSTQALLIIFVLIVAITISLTLSKHATEIWMIVKGA